jgi:hypothetical protein
VRDSHFRIAMASGTEATPHESSRQWLERLRKDRNEVGPEEIV